MTKTETEVTRRTDQIGEQLRAELVRLLRDEVTDPRIAMLTLTRVDVSPDLAQALVFWSPLDPRADRGEQALALIATGLESASSFLRRRVAQQLELRRSPALDFRHDPSLALGAHTLELLNELKADEHSSTAEEAPEDG
jgi:ribosome-binding factor A